MVVDERGHDRWVPPELADLRYRVLSAAFRVHAALGPALAGNAYRRGLIHALERGGLRVRARVPIDLEFDGLRLAGALRLDAIVEDSIGLSIRARHAPLPQWDAELRSLLWHLDLPLGLLINFRVPRLDHGIRSFAAFTRPRSGPP